MKIQSLAILLAVTVSIVGCKGKKSESRERVEAQRHSTFKDRFPSLFAAAYAGTKVNPEDVTYEQFVSDLSLKLKSDSSFLTATKGDTGAAGTIGPQGPQGLQGIAGEKGEQGTSGGNYGAWENWVDVAYNYDPQSSDVRTYEIRKTYNPSYENRFDINVCDYRLAHFGWFPSATQFSELTGEPVYHYSKSTLRADSPFLNFELGLSGGIAVPNSTNPNYSDSLSFSETKVAFWMSETAGPLWYMGLSATWSIESIDAGSTPYSNFGLFVHATSRIRRYTDGKSLFLRLQVRCVLEALEAQESQPSSSPPNNYPQ